MERVRNAAFHPVRRMLAINGLIMPCCGCTVQISELEDTGNSMAGLPARLQAMRFVEAVFAIPDR